jgi:hypothetical protein
MGLMVSEDRCEKVRGKAVVNLRRKVRLKLQSCTDRFLLACCGIFSFHRMLCLSA